MKSKSITLSRRPRKKSPVKKADPTAALRSSESAEDLAIPDSCDKFKILSLRESLRAKFSHTQDLKQLYTQWDTERIGVIRPEDVLRVLSSIGISSELSDVKGLISAVSKNNLGALTYPDFCKLLERKKQEVDLSSYLRKHLIEFAVKFALNGNFRLKKVQNVLKYYLNVNLERLSSEFAKRDPQNTGRVSFSHFVQIMNVMGIPFHTVNGLNLKILFFDLGGDIYGMDYPKFLDYISTCKPFELDTKDDEETLNLNIDPGILTFSKFSDLTNESQRTKRLVKVSVKHKDILLKELLERYGVRVHKNELRHYVNTKGRLPKKDIEAFLEMFLYDNSDYTTTSGVVDWVFDGEEEGFDIKRNFLPKVEFSQMNSTQKFNQLVSNIKTQIGNYAEFDSNNDGYISRDDVRDTLDRNCIVYDESLIKKLFEGLTGEPVLLKAFEAKVDEKFREIRQHGRSYMQPTRCKSKLDRPLKHNSSSFH